MKAFDTPAQHILDTYLIRCLADPIELQSVYEVQVDLLYLLTDRIAHRRALSKAIMPSELSRLRSADAGFQEEFDDQLAKALEPLLVGRIVTQVETAGGEAQYELAHEFLVRSVVQLWQRLDRLRGERTAIGRRALSIAGEKLQHHEQLSRHTFKVLPIMIIAVFSWVASVGFWSPYPHKLGLNILWLIICPACVVAFSGLASKNRTALAFGVISLLSCLAIWVHEAQFAYVYSEYGVLSTPAAWISVSSLFILVVLVPNLWLHAFVRFETSERASIVVRIWQAELIDIVSLLGLIGVLVFVIRLFTADGTWGLQRVLAGDISWRKELTISHASFWFSLGAAVFVISAASCTAAIIRKQTLGGRLTGIALTNSSGLPLTLPNLVARQGFFTLWSAANVFWLMPALIITPIRLIYSKRYQTMVDTLSGVIEVPFGTLKKINSTAYVDVPHSS